MMKYFFIFLICIPILSGCQTVRKDQESLKIEPYQHIQYSELMVQNEQEEYPIFSEVQQQSFLKKGLKSADYLILNSHVFGLMKRPVSSAFQLFTWTRDTAYETLKPDMFMSLFENKPIGPLSKGLSMDLNKWEQRLDKVIGTETSYGDIEFLIGGEAFFKRLEKAILEAKKSIYFRIFIFDNDDYAVKIADLLKAKSNEGVEVKVLLDGMGVVMGEGKESETLPKGFISPDSMPKYLQKHSKIQLRVSPNTWFKVDHIKTIIIDEKVCFTGGMNIGREYRYDWHDLMMEVKGSVIEKIKKDFDSSWVHTSKLGDIAYFVSKLRNRKRVTKKEGIPIRLLYTKLNDPQIYRAQLEAIRASKSYIYISNAYFSDNTILYELIKARRRGVDVRVILPVNGNHKVMNASNVIAANTMYKNGIRVFFYPGMTHVKAAVYDGWLCTGSANFDKLSLLDNLELNLATSHAQTVQIFQEKLFKKDFSKSIEMTDFLQSGFKERMAEFLADHL